MGRRPLQERVAAHDFFLLPNPWEAAMLEKGTGIEMTKGYKGVKGRILAETKSGFEFYIIGLDNGIRLVAGPSAFSPLDENAKQ